MNTLNTQIVEMRYLILFTSRELRTCNAETAIKGQTLKSQVAFLIISVRFKNLLIISVRFKNLTGFT
jgi:hypothetical protein